MTYSRTCGIDQADCTALVCSCANEPHTPTQAEREAFWADEPVRTTLERSQAGREPHSKPGVTCFYFAPGIQSWDVACGCGWIDIDLIDWPSAMDAAHAHVREHHTPTWQPCGRGICAAEAGHEGTCEEASGFVDWTPEFYDDDLDAHRDAMDADTLTDPIARQILAGETDEDDWIDAPPPFGNVPKAPKAPKDPDPSSETWRTIFDNDAANKALDDLLDDLNTIVGNRRAINRAHNESRADA